MKVTLLFLVLSGILGVSLAYTVCTKQSDCQEDECCLDTLFFKRAYCEKRYPAGSSCPTASVYKPEEDMYYFTCPCVPMYECLGKGVKGEDGETYMKDTKCIMPLV
uniref:U41-Sparatoxin-Hju1a_1 n=1 Tax=Heteropoda jugulans TaxID=1358901 RepID=A0A4Q8KBB8_9ARAC